MDATCGCVLIEELKTRICVNYFVHKFAQFMALQERDREREIERGKGCELTAYVSHSVNKDCVWWWGMVRGGPAPTDDNLTIKQLYAAFYELRPRAASCSLSLFLWSLRSNR